MKSIFQYQSYRQFLEDSFQIEKTASGKATLASYARTLGLSTSHFQMIIAGSRNLTVANIHTIARSLRFAQSEQEYFEALVLYDQAKENESKLYYRKRMGHLKAAPAVKRIRAGNRLLNSSALAPVVLMYLLDFEQLGSAKSVADIDQKKLASKFGLSSDQVQKLVEAIQESIVSQPEFSKAAHIIFHKMTHKISEQNYLLDEAAEALRKIKTDFSDPKTFFRAFTITMATSDLPALRTDMLELMEKYIGKNPSAGEQRVIEKVLVAAYPTLIE